MESLERCRALGIGGLFEARLAPPARAWVDRVAELGQARGTGVSLVGGLVRDLLLGIPHRDVDLTVEGDAIAFAEALALAHGGSVRRHGEFGTAVFTSTEDFEIDLVSARSESYPEPASLPRVAPGDLDADLRRRDFTVNALAIRISPEAAPRLLDPGGALADLDRRVLRVFHPASFQDDPTRILRGVRLEARLGFRFDLETEVQARETVAQGGLAPLSGSRLRHELVLLLEDEGAALTGLGRLADLGLLASLDPTLAWSLEATAALQAVERELASPQGQALAGLGLKRWRLLWMSFLQRCASGAELDALVERSGDRLLLEGGDARVLRAFPRRLRRARSALVRESGSPRPHEIAEALQELPPEDLLLLSLAEGKEGASLRAAITLFLDRLRELRPTLHGADLLAAGIPPGPEIGEALRAVRRARWDGELVEADELAYALGVLDLRRAAMQGSEGESAASATAAPSSTMEALRP